MNSSNLVELLQTGFRVSLGATTSLVETLQDPEKREENLAQMRSELSQRVTEWAEKGEITEQEARSFIESVLRQQGQSRPNPSPTTETPSDSVAPPTATTAPPNVQLEIEELTAQIAAIRTELEKLRNPEANL